MVGKSRCTINRKVIRRWVEERGGRPAVVRAQWRAGFEGAAPRIDFPQYRSAGMFQEITWDQFFRKFDERGLAFAYQERVRSGEKSRFFKFVPRDTAFEKGSRP